MHVIITFYYLLLLIMQIRNLFAIPESPCPDIFKYKYENRQWYGEIILIIAPTDGHAFLQVRYTIPTELFENNKGVIRIINTEEIKDSINNNLPVKLIYKFSFPFQDILPIINHIKMNGLLFCYGIQGCLSWEDNHFRYGEYFILVSVRTAPLNVIYENPNKKAAGNIDYTLTWSEPQSPVPTTGLTPMVQSLPTEPVTMLPEFQKLQQTTQSNDQLSDDRIQDFSPKHDFSRICGIEPPVLLQLVVGGRPLDHPQPWLVSFFRTPEYTFFCAGNLITDLHVLTAAHCVQVVNDFIIRIGTTNLKEYVGALRTSAKVYINPEYVPRGSHGDLAILLLNEKVTFSSSIRPLCLWPAYDTNENEIVGRKGIVVGWGNDENGQLSEKEPKKATMRIVSQAECIKNDLLSSIVTDKTLCAVGETHSEGPCVGDSGAALSMLVQNRWSIRGVVSATVADGVKDYRICDVKNYYSVYADVAKHLDWIQMVLDMEK